MNKQNLIPKVNQGRRCQNNIGNGGGYLKCSLSKQRCPFQRYCKNKKVFECTAIVADCLNFKLEKE